MTIKELSVGNWVLDGKNSIPMYVTSVHRDGTVYLDFPGNEALDWETDVKYLVPIELTDELLVRLGFKMIVRYHSYVLDFDDVFVTVRWRFKKEELICTASIASKVNAERFAMTRVQSLHELQNFLYANTDQHYCLPDL